MITCPRCGFEQPKDKYCAKCGVLMVMITQGGKPQDPSTVFMSRGLFYGFLLAVFLLVSAYWFARSNPQILEQPAPQQQVESVPAAPTQPVSAPATPQPVKTLGALAGPRPSPSVSVAPSPVETAISLKAFAPLKLQVKFIKASRDAVEKMNQNVDGGRLSVGDVTMGMVQDTATALSSWKTDSGFITLGDESREASMGQPHFFVRGGTDPKTQRTIGLFVDLTLMRKTEDRGEVRVLIRRSLLDESEATPIVLIDETLNLRFGSGVIVGGMLPRLPQISAEDRDVYNNNRLQVLLDNGFLRGQEEFFVFVSLSGGSR